MGYADAIEQQMSVVRFVGSPAGATFCRRWIERTSVKGPPEVLRRDMRASFMGATPFYVAGPICRLLAIGAGSFRLGAFAVEDFPEPVGWVYFADPLPLPFDPVIGEGLIEAGHMPPLVGLHWVHNDRSFFAVTFFLSPPAGFPCPVMTMLRKWPIGEALTGHGIGEQPAETALWIYAQSLLHFMQQPLVTVGAQRTQNHGARKRALKVLGHDRAVNVVELRRRDNRGRDSRDSLAVDWSCQWFVRPHWRDQWFPRERRNKRIWIDGHVKGPPDKPFLPRLQTAYEVVR
jgi:hypothetical protein